MGSYLFTTSHTSLTLPPGYFLASLPRPPLLSHFCRCFFTLHLPRIPPLPSLITGSAFSSRLASFLMWKACQTLTFSSFLSTSLTLSLLLSFSRTPALSRVFISPFLFCVSASLPFFSVSLHAGDWNVSSLCLRSWGGLSLEKYQSKK